MTSNILIPPALVPPPLNKPVKAPPPILQPRTPAPMPQQKDEPSKYVTAPPMQLDSLQSCIDPSALKERMLNFMNGNKGDSVTKEQAQLDKLEVMLLTLNNAIHSKLSNHLPHTTAPTPTSTINSQLLAAGKGSLNTTYHIQPGLEAHQFASSKKRKRGEDGEDDIEALLKRKVDDKDISFRDGGGGKQIAYLDNYTATRNAVEVLGHDGWSDCILSHTVLVATPDGDNKFHYEVVVLMRMYLDNGCFREDYGFGRAIKTSKGEALTSALKAAATMARKRLWRLCGEYMGNSLYDKIYVEEVSKRRKLRDEEERKNRLLAKK